MKLILHAHLLGDVSQYIVSRTVFPQRLDRLLQTNHIVIRAGLVGVVDQLIGFQGGKRLAAADLHNGQTLSCGYPTPE